MFCPFLEVSLKWLRLRSRDLKRSSKTVKKSTSGQVYVSFPQILRSKMLMKTILRRVESNFSRCSTHKGLALWSKSSQNLLLPSDPPKASWRNKFKKWVPVEQLESRAKWAVTRKTSANRWMTLFQMTGGRKWCSLSRRLRPRRRMQKPLIHWTKTTRQAPAPSQLFWILKTTGHVTIYQANLGNPKITCMDERKWLRSTGRWRLSVAAGTCLSATSKKNNSAPLLAWASSPEAVRPTAKPSKILTAARTLKFQNSKVPKIPMKTLTEVWEHSKILMKKNLRSMSTLIDWQTVLETIWIREDTIRANIMTPTLKGQQTLLPSRSKFLQIV